MHSDIWLVVGTRPEAIKQAPVARALVRRGIAPTLVITGQHPSLDLSETGLHAFDTICLDCPGEADPHVHVRAVNSALTTWLADPPRLLAVQGDTSSAFGAALAGFACDVPVAHVEAGLRTHDPRLPWPEEEYRVGIDARAALLFAPTDVSAKDLRSEQLSGEIHVTGNTGIDALLEIVATLPPLERRRGRPWRILVTCHRRESWSEGLRSIAAALRDLAADGAEIDAILHPNAYVAGKMRALLGGVANIRLSPPCGYRDLLNRMRNCDILLSDSGGIQEEAPALGVPLLILRDKTERPEGITAGASLLVGTDRERITANARRLLDDRKLRESMSRPRLPFGDGRAAERIADIMLAWLSRAESLDAEDAA